MKTAKAPNRTECLEILSSYDVSGRLLLHTLMVSDLAVFLAHRMQPRHSVDLSLVTAGALLHDVGKASSAQTRYSDIRFDHALVSSKIVAELGFESLCSIVRKHMLESIIDRCLVPSTPEEQLIWYADKTVHFRFMGVDGRLNDLGLRHPGSLCAISRIRPLAKTLEAKIMRLCGFDNVDTNLLRRLVSRRRAGHLGSTLDLSGIGVSELAKSIEAANDAGFVSVMLSSEQCMRLSRSGSRPAVDVDVVDACQAGFSLATLAAGGCGHSDEAFERTLESARGLGAKTVRLRAFGEHDVLQTPNGSIEMRWLSLLHNGISGVLARLPKGMGLALQVSQKSNEMVCLVRLLARIGDRRLGVSYEPTPSSPSERGIGPVERFADRVLILEVSEASGCPNPTGLSGRGVQKVLRHPGFDGLLVVRPSTFRPDPTRLVDTFLLAEDLLARADRHM